MGWVITILIVALLIGGFLFTVLRLELDSSVPKASLNWGIIGDCLLIREDEWWIKYRVLFYSKSVPLAGLMKRKKKKTTKRGTSPRHIKLGWLWTRTRKMLRALRIEAWRISMDTGDFSLNAQLFPFHFLPGGRGQFQINFGGEQYFYLRVSATAWKLLLAWFR